MFDPAHVDELFASTALTLQRSQVLFDERRTSVVSPATFPSTFCPSTSSAASTAVGAGAAACHSSSSNSFADTVSSLQSLGQFRAFVEATTAMQNKVEKELQMPSTALQQRRSKGHDLALLQSITRGLCGATATAAWRTSDATAALWADYTEGDGDEGELDDERTTSSTRTTTTGCLNGRTSNGLSSGALVTAALLFGALCVDVAIAVPRAAPSIAADLRRVFESKSQTVITVTEWSREGDVRLRALLREIQELLPKNVMARFVNRVADLLLRPLSPAPATPSSLLGCHQLSGGQFLFPAFHSYLLEQFPSSLASRWLLRPLQSAAQRLRSDYYRSATEFTLQCRWLLSVVFVLVRVCQTAASGDDSSFPFSLAGPHTGGRELRVVQRVYDAWLMPLERTFGQDAARHGMSSMFYENLVRPHAQLVRQLQIVEAGQASEDTADRGIRRGARMWSSVLHTAQYRLLLILEKLAHSEVAQANGTSSTATKQRTYETLLKQNGGKVSVSLLQTLAEDKQLVLEETPSRSPEGHRLYRLHDGMVGNAGRAAKVVFVYVDDGALFTKVGRSRVFQRVKSVEELFRPLQ